VRPGRLPARWLGALLLAGCASGSPGGSPAADQPSPAPGKTPSDADAGHASGVTYRPMRDAAYTLIRHDSLTLQLPGGATQVQLLDRTGYLHLTLAEGPAGGYLATIVLDSLRGTAGAAPLPPDSLEQAKGTHWTAAVSPSGQLADLKADRASTLGDQFSNALRSLFPRLPESGVRAGMEWSDTTEFPLKSDAFDATEHAVTEFRATEGEGTGGSKAIKLESQGTYTRIGKGLQYDQPLEMKASGIRQAVHLLGTDGTLLSAQGSDAGDMTITVPAVGQDVPVKQSGTYRILPTRQR
jgi:hypothetical protein